MFEYLGVSLHFSHVALIFGIVASIFGIVALAAMAASPSHHHILGLLVFIDILAFLSSVHHCFHCCVLFKLSYC